MEGFDWVAFIQVAIATCLILSLLCLAVLIAISLFL